MSKKVKLVGENTSAYVDPMLVPWLCLNTGASSFSLVSNMHRAYPAEHFPWMKDPVPKILLKPGRPTVIPHRYYDVHSRDDSPITFKEMQMDEGVEEFNPNSLIKGGL